MLEIFAEGLLVFDWRLGLSWSQMAEEISSTGWSSLVESHLFTRKVVS